jgi:thioredoxin-like negative regulator of GroEL
MNRTLTEEREFQKFIEENASIIYFSTASCNLCKTLKPKLFEFLDSEFPRFSKAYVDCDISKSLAAQLSIFTVPTIIVFIEGKEMLRKSRHINFAELEVELSRLDKLYFD